MAVGSKLPPRIGSCPQRYGISLNGGAATKYSEGFWSVDPQDSRALVPQDLIWLVEKGDMIFPTDDLAMLRTPEIKVDLKLSFKITKLPQSISITFVASGSNRVPKVIDDLGDRGK